MWIVLLGTLVCKGLGGMVSTDEELRIKNKSTTAKAEIARMRYRKKDFGSVFIQDRATMIARLVTQSKQRFAPESSETHRRQADE